MDKKIRNNSVGFQTLHLLNLEIFKIKKCNKNYNHNNIKCVFYHNDKDRRRNLRQINYNPDICKDYKNCKLSYNCSNSHNKIENLYHHQTYKKKLCQNFITNKNCKFGKFCSFAHSFEKLRIKILHRFPQNHLFFLYYFKTEFCPLGNLDHDKRYCIYSHNYQDYKRINLFNIKLKECSNWDNNNYENYNTNCSKGIYCNYLHGWKEMLFHPINYKRKFCNNMKSCKIKLICNKKHLNEPNLNMNLPDMFVYNWSRIHN